MSVLIPEYLTVHPRTAWRYVAGLLLADSGFPGPVYPNREEPWLSHELPAIGIYTTQETKVEQDISPDPDDRLLTLVVEILAGRNERLDDNLDAFSLIVERSLTYQTMARASGQWPLVDFVYSDTTLGFADDGERLVGLASLTFDLTYRFPAEPLPLNDFLLAIAGWDVEKHDGCLDMVSRVAFEPAPQPGPEAPADLQEGITQDIRNQMDEALKE